MTLESQHSPDVLILGGGVIGLACALRLLQAGRAVTVLEQGRLGRGSSHGNCGTITPSHLPLTAPGTVVKGLKWMFTPDAPFRIKPTADPALLSWLLSFARRCSAVEFRRVAGIKTRLLQASRDQLAQLVSEESLDCEFVESGTMYVWKEAAAFAAALGEFELLQDLGIPIERFEGNEARRREAALNGSIVGGHFHAGDARLRPDRYVAELARVVRALGGVIEENEKVQGFRVEAGRVVAVVTDRKSFSAPSVVMALGAWSPAVARPLGLRLPIQPGKGYSMTFARPERVPVIPLVLKERSVCVTSWESGYRLGSTMEFAGYDSSLNRVRLAALSRAAAEYLHPPSASAVEEEWFGWRPMTPDDLPIIGQAPGLSNLVLATGHGMLGVTLSAITATLVTEILTGRPASIDLAPYSPQRF